MQCSSVTITIAAVGQTITIATGKNPTKVVGSDKFLLQEMQIQLAEYANADPPTKKKLPVESDVPEQILEMVYK